MPDPARGFTLEIQREGRPVARRHFTATRVTIGRDAGDIVLHDHAASASHAELHYDRGQLIVRDLGSSNGTWLGARRLSQFAISEGQSFRCGSAVILVVSVDDGEAFRAGGTVISGSIKPAEASAARSRSAPRSSSHAAGAGRRGGLGWAMIAAASLALLGLVAGLSWWLYAEYRAYSERAAAPSRVVSAGAGGELFGIPSEPDLGAIYRTIGAATVVIKVPGTVGSGTLIELPDPPEDAPPDRVIILTNQHVIQNGEFDGLRQTANVFFPRFSDELQAFEPDERSFAAQVLKVDAALDLALLAVDGAPPGPPRVPIAAEAPYPGQRVAAIGHAGAGMLWAIKGGEVSSTGKLSGHTDLNLKTHEGDPAVLREVKATFERQGRVLQTTAEILPGDSGGPLVNLAGELVGVNAFVRTDNKTNQWLSFHVHLDTIRPFIATVPTRAREFLPDPWRYGDASLEDADLDGVFDVLKLERGDDEDGWAALIDLDQDSKLPEDADADALARARGLDVELAVLFERDTRHFWYDLDNDGALETYLVDRKGTGQLDEAYTLTPGEPSQPSRELLERGRRFDGGLFLDAQAGPGLAARFRRIGSIVLPDLVADAPEGDPRLPNPLQALGGDVRLVDVDGDGRSDLVREQTAFHRRVLIDLDGDASFRKDGDERDEDEPEPVVDIELVIIRQGARAWVYYDRENAGRFDLVLHSTNSSAGVAHDGWARGPGGALTRLPEHAGRRLIRPDLFSSFALRSRVAELVTDDDLEPQAVATDDGLGSLPGLELSDSAQIVVPDYEERGAWKNSIARVTDRGRDLTMIDLDGDSLAPGIESHEAALAIRAGKFDAEFVWMRHSGRDWTFYDTDDDGRFDLVLYGGDPSGLQPTHAFVPGVEDGLPALQSVPEQRGESMMRWRVFTAPAAQQRFKAISELLFPERASREP